MRPGRWTSFIFILKYIVMELPPQNPYQTSDPLTSGYSNIPPEQPSGIPKVFGILHIIYAALGGIGALIGLGSGALVKTMFENLTKEAKEDGQDISPVTDALDGLMTVSMIQSAFSIGFAVLLLVAGIKLLKYQNSGRKLSNIWAIARIVVAVPLVFMSISAQTKFQDEIQKLAPEGTAMDMGAMAGVGGVVGIILVSVYPIVSLILVNKPKSKAALK